MLIYIIYFVVIAILAVEYELNKFNPWPMFAIMIGMLGILAGFRGQYVSKDFDNYQYSFETAYIYFDKIKHGSIFNFFEPGYILVVVAMRKLFEINYGVATLVFFAFTSITLKIVAINKFKINPFLVLLFYFSHYFDLHEMTQIRVGFSVSIFFIALIFYLRRDYLTYILLILVAILFHYSALIYFLIFLFNDKKLNKYLYGGALVLSIILGIIKLPLFDVVNAINPDIISGKLKSYETIAQQITDFKVNFFNIINIANILAAGYYVFFIPATELAKKKGSILFIKCSIFSIFLLSLLSGVPIIAFRVSELFGVMSVFLFAGLVYYLPFNRLNIFFLILLASLFFYINVFHNQLLDPYYFNHIKWW